LATLQEEREGRGPCYFDTKDLSIEEEKKLKEVYLNMNPAIVLLWANDGYNPRKRPVEIGGMEPVVIGGHCQAGYWIDGERRTSINGLFAAGDVAGGAPKKYVSGAWVEGKIATKAAVEEVKEVELLHINGEEANKEKERILSCMNGRGGMSPEELERNLQEIMDEYAGGATSHYELTESKLIIARQKLKELKDKLQLLSARDKHELVSCLELIDRFDVAKVLIEHLLYRKETRWPVFQTRTDYPEKDDTNWLGFVNSVYDPVEDRVKIIKRALKKENEYLYK
jgi:adenylylsulfate reductase subunit A